MLVFSAVGFSVKREDGRIVPRALVVTAVFTAFLLIPLTWLSVQFFQSATENRLVNEVVAEEVIRFNVELADLSVENLDGTIHIELTVRTTEPLSYEDVNQIQQDIAVQLQKPVSVVVNQIFASKLDPLVPPTLTITPSLTSTPTPVTLTATLTPSPTLTLTPTPSATPVPPTFTPTPSIARITNTNGRLLIIVQTPGGPSIGTLRNGDYITVLYGSEILDGLVWLEIMDKDGRIGWIPQINISVVTLTPSVTAAP